MKTAAKFLFFFAGLSAVLTLAFFLGGGWNVFFALIVLGPTTLILLAVGLLLLFASGIKVNMDSKVKLGIVLLILSAATWFYVVNYLSEGSFFIPFLPQIIGSGTLISGVTLIVIGLARPRLEKIQKVTPHE